MDLLLLLLFLFLGSGPEGVDDLCFHTYGEFSPSPSSDWDLGLWAGIQALGPRFGPHSRICVGRGGGTEKEKKEEEGGENSPYV